MEVENKKIIGGDAYNAVLVYSTGVG